MIYYLSLGANIGEREQTIQSAVELIEQQVGHVLRRSSFYYSEPWGFESPNPFCNLCCAVQTTKQPLEVLSLTQAIERALGRKEKSSVINHQSSMTNDGNEVNRALAAEKCQMSNYTDRCIDIDLIRAFDEQGEEIKCEIINHKSQMSSVPLLSLPHPLWKERDFVKVPLKEIMQ